MAFKISRCDIDENGYCAVVLCDESADQFENGLECI